MFVHWIASSSQAARCAWNQSRENTKQYSCKCNPDHRTWLRRPAGFCLMWAITVELGDQSHYVAFLCIFLVVWPWSQDVLGSVKRREGLIFLSFTLITCSSAGSRAWLPRILISCGAGQYTGCSFLWQSRHFFHVEEPVLLLSAEMHRMLLPCCADSSLM